MKTYLKQASREEREALAVAVKSSVPYFYLIGGGHRKAGNDLCKALVATEPKLTLHELRPDIWSAEMSSSSNTRRATDPVLDPGHRGRQPPSRDSIMTFGGNQPSLHEDAKRS